MDFFLIQIIYIGFKFKQKTLKYANNVFTYSLLDLKKL